MHELIENGSDSRESRTGLPPTVLIVDDEQVILKLLQTALSIQGYRVIGVNDPREALRTVKTGQPDYDVAIIDQSMPHLSGTELAAHLRTHRPEIKMILMSGYGETLDLPALDNDCRFIGKPFSLPQLFAMVREMLA